MRKNVLFRFLISIAFCLPALSASAGQNAQAASPGSVNIMEIANAQMFRYGRELYRKGDYAKAAGVFKKILDNDCTNTLAQYHLQKIAQKGPEFQSLTTYLKSLPCPMYDFTKNDFLPATLYYEKDKDLLLEQMAVYNKRCRAIDNAVSTQMGEYEDKIDTLEQNVSTLSQKLEQTRSNKDQGIAKLKADFEQKERLCRELDNEVSRLKNELAAARASRKTEVQALEDQLTAVQSRADEAAKTAETSSQAWEDRLARENALRELNAKDLELKAKNRELTTLQEKFADVQDRLDMIERAAQDKNIQIQTIRKDLQTIRD